MESQNLSEWSAYKQGVIQINSQTMSWKTTLKDQMPQFYYKSNAIRAIHATRGSKPVFCLNSASYTQVATWHLHFLTATKTSHYDRLTWTDPNAHHPPTNTNTKFSHEQTILLHVYTTFYDHSGMLVFHIWAAILSHLSKQGPAVHYTILRNEQLGTRISRDTSTETLSPACILLQIKLTDVLASSACLNSQDSTVS
jgi:hypothetical protein